MVFERDAEGVKILGKDYRAVGTLIEIAQLTVRGVMRCVDIGHLGEIVIKLAEVAAHLRVTDGARGVELLLYVMAQLHADISKRILVAKTPDEHRWVVLIAADSGLSTLLQHRIELAFIKVLIAIAKGNLVDDVESQRVGQFVESWFARIVRGADIVDRGLLHHLHILKSKTVADNLACERIGRVSINATQLEWHAVKLKNLSVGNGKLAETELMMEGLERFALLLESGAQGVEIRSLGGPEIKRGVRNEE